ncbi:bis(5'-nucleosyl)-tetraphosphatase (symmetrical) YqeK [Bacillus sp. H-16]|uniref:bis(5'-nucleosyl)-tetraphosphatase (symmetrical) YqeK n=1 Tax=Alteribacter salitolerans TaxID=2912333 RepID=UPI00196445A1|nr:bis(5'-nucleosyl)-tetraphosphatase (symmetrical) YqeK [Alteribacter salitolerans]MBM7097138.1 bis(5'-nucleosyl)-tetraphosphatase (symmetrical) YqeK [Alteribacter salitolerans]
MNEQRAFEAVKKQLKPARYEHTLRVVETAEELAGKYHARLEKVRLAAILHDYAKYRPAGEMKEVIRSADWLSDEWCSYGEAILHAPAGAALVRSELGITDEDVIRAIVYHTTGRAGMTLIEKIVFLADYIEPGRKFPGIESVRQAADDSLDRGCLLALANTIGFLTSKKQPVFPDTFHAYNELVKLTMRGLKS